MDYTCPHCNTAHPTFEAAARCHEMEYVVCPFSELPGSAPVGYGLDYTFGNAFTGRYELVKNRAPLGSPVRVYPLPPLMSEMVAQLLEREYQRGVETTQQSIRKALGLDATLLKN